jgi:hypothetical protein
MFFLIFPKFLEISEANCFLSPLRAPIPPGPRRLDSLKTPSKISFLLDPLTRRLTVLKLAVSRFQSSIGSTTPQFEYF